MQFIHHDLGYMNAGDMVEVTLSARANVRLMDSANFQSFRSGRRPSYVGGQATRSPFQLQVPRAGHWHVTIDLGGYRGQVRSGVRVLPGRLPPIPAGSSTRGATRSPASPVAAPAPAAPRRSRPTDAPLSSVPSLVRGQGDDLGPEPDETTGDYDVFICHASEDKDEVVRPLAHALDDGGLSVWYDEFELRIGDSLRRKIDKGLASSRFGIVVLSQTFFGKGWANYELDGLVTRAVSGEQVILPIWHKVTKQEVMKYSASLADKVARSTSSHTVEEIAAEIAEVVRAG